MIKINLLLNGPGGGVQPHRRSFPWRKVLIITLTEIASVGVMYFFRSSRLPIAAGTVLAIIAAVAVKSFRYWRRSSPRQLATTARTPSQAKKWVGKVLVAGVIAILVGVLVAGTLRLFNQPSTQAGTPAVATPAASSAPATSSNNAGAQTTKTATLAPKRECRTPCPMYIGPGEEVWGSGSPLTIKFNGVDQAVGYPGESQPCTGGFQAPNGFKPGVAHFTSPNPRDPKKDLHVRVQVFDSSSVCP